MMLLMKMMKEAKKNLGEGEEYIATAGNPGNKYSVEGKND